MAMDMFIKLGTLKGESGDADPKHKDTIDVLAWSWGMSNSGNAHQGGGLGVGKASVQDISFTKWIDRSSPEIMANCLSGKHFPDAKLTVRKAGDKPLEYLVITLQQVLVTSVSTGGSGGEDRLTENVTLNFAKVKLDYMTQKDDGTPGDPIKVGWDIAGNAKW
ncbi:type VI secretion system receptor/chaperone Hcp [soil metagenome]|nr:type VI secretion system tube protein Hcp [Gemmatimonadota bacterium]